MKNLSEKTAPVVELKDITKAFPGVIANDRISISFYPGEVHALLGENGAGKTTLMNILYGLYPPDGGQIFVRGKPVVIKSPTDALSHGIGMVHQHFMLVPPFTVAENIVLGSEPRKRRFFLDMEKAVADVEALSDRYGFKVDPRAKIQDISVGMQQRVEILNLPGARFVSMSPPLSAPRVVGGSLIIWPARQVSSSPHKPSGVLVTSWIRSGR